MASGMARGAAARGKRIAFGNGRKIIWDGNSAQIFKNNPNVAPPGGEKFHNLEWIGFYKGNRIYNRQEGERWVWNYKFRPKPGEIFFDHNEREFAKTVGSGFVVIEPNVPWNKAVAPNKDWGFANYMKVAAALTVAGYEVVQFTAGALQIPGIRKIKTPTFRHALAALSRASLAVCPEGGLHHGAAAVGVPAVVLFGGFIPPEVTGYDTHTNMTGGAQACGSLQRCEHCRAAMEKIRVEEVIDLAQMRLKEAA